MSSSDKPLEDFDDDLLLLAGGLVFRRDIQYTVSVDIEAHFNLRHARVAPEEYQSDRIDPATCCLHGCSLALQNVDGHRSLIVIRR